MRKSIAQYNVVDITSEVSELSVKQIEQFSLSHHLQIPDSIIGATAIIFDLPLFTYNTKDFKFMPNIRLYK
jgi:predicted nucleic acid-binding protein